MNYDQLNPGIRETVRFLNDEGFTTCDSGDGVTREHECDPGIPYVVIQVSPLDLVDEADRLKRVLEEFGVELGPMDEENTTPTIEASYNPLHNGRAFITLWNVKDKAAADA